MSNGNRRHPGITARHTKNRGTVYEVRFRGRDGREISKTFRSLAAARRWQVDQQRARNKGLWTDPRLGQRTFEEWSSEWLGSNPAKRQRTLHRDKQVLEVVIKTWSGRSLDSLMPEDCRRLVAEWISHKYSPSTVRRMAAVVKAILNSAVDADLIGRTPWRGIRLPQVDLSGKPPLSPSEVLMLVNEVDQVSGLVVLTAALCGLRFGECAGLRICDVDLDRAMLSVRQTLGEVGGKVIVNPPKSRAGERALLMPSSLVGPMTLHLAQRRLESTPDELLFVSAQGGPLRYPNFRNRVFSPACKRLGLNSVTFHDLRKFNATLMVTGGVDVKTAQVRLGHSDPRLTLSVYAQATTDSQLNAATAINEGFEEEVRFNKMSR